MTTGVHAARRRIGDILLGRGLITSEQLDEALELQRGSPAPLGSILIGLGFVDEDRLVATLAEEHGVRPWDLRSMPPDPSAVRLVPGDVATSYKVLPLVVEPGGLVLAMAEPEDIEALELVRYLTRMPVERALVARHRLLKAIRDCHESQPS